MRMNTDERPAKKRCVWMRARAQSLTDNAEWRRRVNCEMGWLFGLGTRTNAALSGVDTREPGPILDNQR